MIKIESVKRFLTGGTDRSKAIKKNIIGGLLIKGISILISILIVPLTLGYVNSEMYGIWLTLSSIMMWMYFFDGGFTLGLRNKLTEALANNDYAKGKSLVTTTYVVMILIFVPFCMLLESLLPFVDLSALLNVDAKYELVMRQTMSLLILFCCMNMIVNVFSSVLAAYQKVALSSLFSVIGQAISLVIIYCMTLYCTSSLPNLALAISLWPTVITLIASIFFFRGKFKSVAPKLKMFRREYVKDLFSLGGKFFFIQLQVVIMYQCTNILISNVSGPEIVTEYNIAYKYLGVAMMVFSIIVSPLWPAMTDAFTKNDFIWMNGVYKKMTKVYGLLFLGLVFMLLTSPIVYKLWIGDKAHVAFLMSLMVAIYMLVYSWGTLHVQLINGIGTIKLQTYITLIGLLFHIPFSLLLGKYMGVYGVLTSMISINMLYVVVFTMQVRRIINRTAKGIWIK